MAYAMTKQGSRDNVITYEFMCDTLADMNAIESEYRTLGSIAIVLQGESEALEVYICDSTRQWIVLNAGGSSNPETGGGGSLSIYICAQNEVDNGLPDIAEPDENTIYLVPAGKTSGNLYEEYIYVNEAWEKFGAATIDLSNYATKSEIPDTSIYAPIANPNFTGSISLGRKANTTIGSNSTAIGINCTASGNFAHAEGEETQAIGASNHAEGYKTIANSGTMGNYRGAHAEGNETSALAIAAHAEGNQTTASNIAAHSEGNLTIASGLRSHAEGTNTTASGSESHAEGSYTTASGKQSHAEGSSTTASGNRSHTEGANTVASGENSHAEGSSTLASSRNQHVAGQYNVAFEDFPIWVEGASYSVGDYVKHLGAGWSTAGYRCIEAHDNSTAPYNNSKWEQLAWTSLYSEIIGNGTSNNARSNARALGWDGTEYLAGNLYVNCNNDSTGGNKVATEVYVNAVIPGIASNATAGLIKIPNQDRGLELYGDTNDIITIRPATEAQIKTATNYYCPIGPARQYISVFYGLAKAAGDTTQATSENVVGTYTADAKAAIQTMLGVSSSADLAALTNRVAELESEITSLRNALNLLNVPENAVRGADGTPVTDEALNYVEFDEPTT